jgi:hypothetical protein
MWFLLGDLRFLRCNVVVNRGEFVVECVANVGCRRTLLRGFKLGQVSQVNF